MRAVADTNVVVSGLLWRGPERQVLDLARVDKLELFTSIDLASELQEILNRRKFAERLRAAQVDASKLMAAYTALATLVRPASIQPVVLSDPDDDAVIACAIAAHADFIISGDRHLRTLKQYQEIQIVSAVEFMSELG